MTIDNRNATLLGVFFIAAAVTAIIAGVINDRTVLSDVWGTIARREQISFIRYFYGCAADHLHDRYSCNFISLP